MKKMNTSGKAGFTLVEIMIVVAIIGLLAAIAIPSFVNARTKSQTNACLNNLRQINGGKDQYALDHNNTAPALADLTPTYIAKDPQCPATSAAYTVGALGSDPTCAVGGTHTI